MKRFPTLFYGALTLTLVFSSPNLKALELKGLETRDFNAKDGQVITGKLTQVGDGMVTIEGTNGFPYTVKADLFIPADVQYFKAHGLTFEGGAGAAPSSKGSAKPKRDWEQRFKKLDTNGDGQLTLAELLAGSAGQRAPKKTEAFFKTMDKQNRGSVTLDQWMAAHSEGKGAPDSEPTGAPDSSKNMLGEEIVVIKGMVTQRNAGTLMVITLRGPVVMLNGYEAQMGKNIEVKATKTGTQTFKTFDGKTQSMDQYTALPGQK